MLCLMVGNVQLEFYKLSILLLFLKLVFQLPNLRVSSFKYTIIKKKLKKIVFLLSCRLL